MKKKLVKTAILLFGVICISMVILVAFYGDSNHYEELCELSQHFSDSPSEETLRDLLNYPADGAYAYFQLALIGGSFTKHPEVYGELGRDLRTDNERSAIRQLLSLGDGVFEYHPERKPEGFDQAFSANKHLFMAN